MGQRDPLLALRHMRDHASEAIGLARGHRRRDLDSDRLLLHGLTHLVEIVGEAAGRVPQRVRDEHPEIPWPDVIGMRHRLIHGYDAVNLDVLWATLEEDLPALVRQLDSILSG